MISTGWLPAVEPVPSATSAWTGILQFKAFDDRWSEASWFNPAWIEVVIEVSADGVVVRSGGHRHGFVSRDELRVWFCHGTADLEAEDVTWRARPMGVALMIAGWGTAPVPGDIASRLAARL